MSNEAPSRPRSRYTRCAAGRHRQRQRVLPRYRDLDHFTYSLTDLDPNDGIAPSITFLPVPAASGNTASLQVEYAFGHSVMPLTKRAIGTESISLDGTRSPSLSLSASASGLDSLATVSLNASLIADNDSYLGTLTSYASSGSYGFVLSPHTELSVIAVGHFIGTMVPTGDNYVGLGADIVLDDDHGHRLNDFTASWSTCATSSRIGTWSR